MGDGVVVADGLDAAALELIDTRAKFRIPRRFDGLGIHTGRVIVENAQDFIGEISKLIS